METEILHEKTSVELINIVGLLQNNLDKTSHNLAQAEDTIKKQNDFIAALQQELKLSRMRHYGRKSEKTPDGAKQLDLFNEAECAENTKEVEAVEEEITIPAHKRKKSGRKPLPKDLPRVQVIHDLDEQDKVCACGCSLTKIAEEKTEQLDIIPAKIRVIENIKYKYACKGCEDTIKTATPPMAPIPKSIATPGLLSHVLIAKFKDHLPLYRQENIFNRMGVDIARNTLSNWVIKSGDILQPIYDLLQADICSYDIAYADETRVQVLKEPDRNASSQSYMWCFIGGPPDKRSIIYHYDPGRSHVVIEEVMKSFSGSLHCDGYSGYDCYAQDRDVVLIGCWMHARRRFAEIVKLTKSEGLAHKALELISKLYKVEKHIKSQGYCVSEIHAYRLKHAKKVLDKFKYFLDSNYPKVLPKSPIGKAIYYCLNQWPKLVGYLADGRLEIDNGFSERQIKPFVIGRKNWLFNNSISGVRASQVIYSIIETCCAHKLEPYGYLRYLLTELPRITEPTEIQELLPWNIVQDTLNYN